MSGVKCTDKQRKLRFAALAAAGILLFSGCGAKTYELEHPYDVYGTSIHYEQPLAFDESLVSAQRSCASAKTKRPHPPPWMHPQPKLPASFIWMKKQFHTQKIFMKNYIRPVRPKYLPHTSRSNTQI